MSIPSWLLKPIIKEVVKTAMKTFFDDYFTKALIVLIFLVNAVALLVKVEPSALDSFNILAASLAGLNAGKSVLHDFAASIKSNHSQETKL
jgi:hypothetical protein